MVRAYCDVAQMNAVYHGTDCYTVLIYLLEWIHLLFSITLFIRIAEWLVSRTTKQEGPGSNPGGGKEI